MNLLMEVLENPSSASVKRNKILAESADEMVVNPNYRDLVKTLKEFLQVHDSFDQKTKDCMVKWPKEMNWYAKIPKTGSIFI